MASLLFFSFGKNNRKSHLRRLLSCFFLLRLPSFFMFPFSFLSVFWFPESQSMLFLFFSFFSLDRNVIRLVDFDCRSRSIYLSDTQPLLLPSSFSEVVSAAFFFLSLFSYTATVLSKPRRGLIMISSFSSFVSFSFPDPLLSIVRHNVVFLASYAIGSLFMRLTMGNTSD